MNIKKQIILLTFVLIVTIQILLFVNNKQKSSFRYLIWNIQNVSIGKLISLSFISGISVSTLINILLIDNVNNFKTNNTDNIDREEEINIEDYSLNNKDNADIPPQRDVRDTQPTISVNYRVIKDSRYNDFDYENKSRNYNKQTNYDDDWNNDQSEW